MAVIEIMDFKQLPAIVQVRIGNVTVNHIVKQSSKIYK